MAWLHTGLTAIVVCDHGSVKPTGVRAGAGRRGHFPATTADSSLPQVFGIPKWTRDRLKANGASGRFEVEPAVEDSHERPHSRGTVTVTFSPVIPGAFLSPGRGHALARAARQREAGRPTRIKARAMTVRIAVCNSPQSVSSVSLLCAAIGRFAYWAPAQK